MMELAHHITSRHKDKRNNRKISFFLCTFAQKAKNIPNMENYIVSARKYRPSTFESVVGQRALTTTLKNAIATGKLAHAYLFCGPRGVGKRPVPVSLLKQSTA